MTSIALSFDLARGPFPESNLPSGKFNSIIYNNSNWNNIYINDKDLATMTMVMTMSIMMMMMFGRCR